MCVCVVKAHIRTHAQTQRTVIARIAEEHLVLIPATHAHHTLLAVDTQPRGNVTPNVGLEPSRQVHASGVRRVAAAGASDQGFWSVERAAEAAVRGGVFAWGHLGL